MTFRVGPLSLFMLRKTAEKHYPGGIAARRIQCIHVEEKQDLLMVRGTTDRDLLGFAYSIAASDGGAIRRFTMVDGLCGPYCVSPGIVVERSRNETSWPPFIWTVRAAGSYRRLGGTVIEFPCQFRPLQHEGQPGNDRKTP